MTLRTLPLTSNNPFHPLHGIEKHLPCGDVSHHQPLFYPTPCHHPHKVLVADLKEGMGTLFHMGSTRNPAFGLWPLSQNLVQTVRRDLEAEEKDGGVIVGSEEGKERKEDGEEVEATSLSAFLGEGNDDTEWEIVDSPKVAREKYVLVGKREVAVEVVERRNPEWVRAS